VDADTMIVGEAPGAEEERRGEPFVGLSGQELSRMLQEAGIHRAFCRIVNVCPYRPPGNDIDGFFLNKTAARKAGVPCVQGRYPAAPVVEGLQELRREILTTRPKRILLLGGTALWAVLGLEGIAHWRGSELTGTLDGVSFRVVPTWHPAAVLRSWELRYIAVRDMRRLVSPGTPPVDDFRIAPAKQEVLDTLSRLQGYAGDIAVDLETHPASKHITCCGLAWEESGETRALCIPFTTGATMQPYWRSAAEEAGILLALRRCLQSEVPRFAGHNYLFDMQMMARWWGFLPRLHMDTMLTHHVVLPGLLKSLDFCASLYLPYYRQWSLTEADWKLGVPDETLWTYNCRDVQVTLALVAKLREAVHKEKLEEQVRQQHALLPMVLEMSLRGMRLDVQRLPEVRQQLQEAMRKTQEFLDTSVGHPLNPRSAVQLKRLFYADLQVKPRLKRGSSSVTCDKTALREIGQSHPLLRPLTNAILDYRSLGVLKSTFVDAQYDPDGRARTSFNMARVHTFRLSSSESIFGTGINMQNVPKPDKGKAVGVNLRELFLFDGIGLECDLDRADLQVVVWEADDAELKHLLRSGADLHMENARTIFGAAATARHRELAKAGVHLTNYGGRPPVLAATLGITRAEAEKFQARWFAAHPGIKRWHRRVEMELATTRATRNAFGYRRHWFDRLDAILPEALAWGPQSTVALVINQGILQLKTALPQVQLLMQIHDSVVFQLPPDTDLPGTLPAVKAALRVPVPYPDPLIIPASARISTTTWAACTPVPNW
jgi:DNA polymerase I-like protein with 3'-5' exonuclease and polymerase domains/uracil-DNA glycosylase